MGDVKIPNWLKGLPLAPEFYPTHTEFADPIAYISKIEKEASEFGICKIIPPLPKPSKKYVFSNLNKSLAKRPELGEDVKLGSECSPVKMGSEDGSNDEEVRAVFTTRHQELGQTVKRTKGAGAAAIQNASSGVDKQVWQSGEVYTLEQFETKAKVFARSILGTVKEVCPLVIEAMFWKAASEKPIYVEYANDVPGSAFEEPEGQLRYFHRRRRKRNSYQRSGANSDCKKGEMISSCGTKSQNSEVKDASPNNVSDTCLEVSKSPASPKTVSTDDTSQHSRRKNPSSSCEMEGSAGWNLSNSPWNLQVIARAPGSLTRFMPDDIPGVTSPMIYIGMLFSWFAWHVEDHELHSMNFLHNGSSKTWYAVPGDYAFAFEELVRTEAYGGTADRLDALSLLGNKTTLMSPEVVIASGIPCCRLIQNPGEFVVTFPRSYHVGFSHGFNCGEAANFGTPQWLKVAKEAAVRRAAMNYLPMLSHQQLLYLSTMSFVSRVPKSLLPGVRSSRMRDRQKEDRELSVKKAFIEDILNENDVLSALIGKDSGYRAVLWNPDLLPYASKDSPIPSASAPADVNSKENASNTQFGNSANDRNFFDEMSLYMENMNDLYLGSDDLSSDFQVDSGTLACVACGILGFPFMCVVQPSEKASIELQHEEFPGVSGLKNSSSSSEHHKSLKGYTTEDLPLMSNAFTPANDPLIPCSTKFNKHWNTDSNFLRPRSFCLEHAVETLELLQCKGGANVLVICHSDYQKIKAPAAAIAEEIGFPFNYNEVSLDNALKEDLNLIDLAIDHGRDECGEDWTSKLGINLRYCVKVRKTSSSKRVQHALALGGFFSKQSSIPEFQTVNWQSRRSRSKKVYLDPPYKEGSDSKKIDAPYKQGGISDKKKEVMAAMSADATSIKRREKIIQYSRRNKPKTSISIGVGTVVRHSEGLDEYSRRATSNGKSTGNCARFDSTQSNSISEIHHVAQMLEAASDTSLNFPPSEVTDWLALITGTVDARMENQSLEENSRNGNGCKLSAQESDMQDETETPEEAQENKSVAPLVIEGNERFEKNGEEQITEELNKRQSQVLADEDIGMIGFSGFTKSTNLCAGSSIVTTAEELMVNEVNEVFEKSFVDRSIEGEHMSTSVTLGELTHPCISVEESSNIPRGSSSEEGMGNGVPSDTVVQQGVQTTNESTEAPRHSFVARIENHPILVSVEDRVPRVTYATDGFTDSVTLDKKERRTNTDSDEGLVASHDTSKCDLSRVQIKTYSRVKRGSHAAQDFPNGSEDCTSQCDGVLDNIEFSIVDSRPSPKLRNKRKSGVEQLMDDNINFNGFVRGPCEGLRPRSGKDATRRSSLEIDSEVEEKPVAKKLKKPSDVLIPKDKRKEPPRKSHRCNIGNCRMSFQTKEQLMVHKRNRCPHEECGKKFRSHKYAMVHSRVHDKNRPFKCSWKGCSMSFKWEWSRTEHMRVHTGEKPYKCKMDDCGLSFRFVSDLSRHRRKMGHYMS